MQLTFFSQFLLLFVSSSGAKVQWNVQEKISQFGEDLKLLCSHDSYLESSESSKRWIMHMNPELQVPLTLNGASYDQKKYDVSIEEKGFSLVIKNLTRDDLKYLYQCYHGFIKSEKIDLRKSDIFDATDSSGEHSENYSHVTEVVIAPTGAVLIIVIVILVVLSKKGGDKDFDIKCTKRQQRAAETRIKMCQDKEIGKTEYITIANMYKQLPQEMPAARAVRQDRPEIQIDIQKAKIIPVIPEQPPEERREPPVFTKPLRPSRVMKGKPVTLEVHFKGFPPPIISWYRDNFEIQPSHYFQINTTETVSMLSIPEVFPEDTGMFMVKAYNMYGTVQCKAKLTVVEEEEPERNVPLEFKSLIRDTNAVQGEPATFDCQVSGRPKPKVEWQKDGQAIPDSPRSKFIEEDENNTFLIYEVKPEDAGQYSCVALNPVGKATCTARLNVEGTEITQNDDGFHANVNVNENTEIKLLPGHSASYGRVSSETDSDKMKA